MEIFVCEHFAATQVSMPSQNPSYQPQLCNPQQQQQPFTPFGKEVNTI